MLLIMVIIPKNDFANENSGTDELMLGDVNGDKEINENDVIIMLKHISATKTNKNPKWILGGKQLIAGNICNEDGEINTIDVISLLRYIACMKSPKIAKENPAWLNLGGKQDDDETVDAKDIKLDKSDMHMRKGETYTLTATISPENATDKRITWTSSNEDVVTVNEKGQISCKSAGNAIITASLLSGKEARCTITVEDSNIEFEDIHFSNTETTIQKGKDETLNVILSDESDNTSIIWKSSDETIATVDQNGKIVTKKAGTVIITAETENGKKAECKVIVVEESIEPKGIILSRTRTTMKKGNEELLIAEIVPHNATEKEIIWSSSNTSVATVDQNGKITAIDNGIATIKAETKNGMSAECNVAVWDTSVEAERIVLNKPETTLEKGKEELLIAEILPGNATEKEITWSSSNTSVANVDQNGKVFAKNVGTATIKATLKNGNEAECIVTVVGENVEVESIELNKQETEIRKGEEEILVATILPANATDQTKIWTSEDETVATVDRDGKVIANDIGFTTITVTTINDKTASCLVTVTEGNIEIEEITLDAEEITIEKGETKQLTATTTPEDIPNKTLVWMSGDTEIATVDEEGVVTAVAEGSTVVSVSTNNDKMAMCVVNVTDANSNGESDGGSGSSGGGSSSSGGGSSSSGGGSSSSGGGSSTEHVPAESIKIERETDDIIKEGDTVKFKCKIEPSNATNQDVEWYSSNTTVALQSDGTNKLNPTFTTNYAGRVTITATLKDNDKELTDKYVLEISSLGLNKNFINLYYSYENGRINPGHESLEVIDPNSVNNVKWKVIGSSRSDEIDVTPNTDDNKKITITAYRKFEKVIEARKEDGTLIGSCLIISKPKGIKITLYNDSIKLKSYSQYRLSVKEYDPYNLDVEDRKILWGSSDPSVASIEQDRNNYSE